MSSKGPDFLIVGAGRCGSTTLYENLSHHPDISRGRRKEYHHWNRPEHLRKRSLAQYEKALGAGGLRCDCTPAYFLNKDATKEIGGRYPAAKIIILLREPIARAYSHMCRWFEMCQSGRYLWTSMNELVSQEIGIIRSGKFPGRPRAVLTGMYADHIETWKKYFPTDKILILKSEDMFESIASAYRRVVEFLGISDWEPSKFSQHNRRKSECPPMDEETESVLRDFYAPQVKRLYEEHVDWRWEEWRDLDCQYA